MKIRLSDTALGRSGGVEERPAEGVRLAPFPLRLSPSPRPGNVCLAGRSAEISRAIGHCPVAGKADYAIIAGLDPRQGGEQRRSRGRASAGIASGRGSGARRKPRVSYTLRGCGPVADLGPALDDDHDDDGENNAGHCRWPVTVDRYRRVTFRCFDALQQSRSGRAPKRRQSSTGPVPAGGRCCWGSGRSSRKVRS